MNINLVVLSSVVNSRVLRTGEEKGQIKYSVDIYAHSGDNIPSKFVVSGLSSQDDAQALASKYPHNSKVVVRYTPRDSVWLDASEIQPVK